MDFSELFGGASAPQWVSGTNYPQNKVVRGPTDSQLYVRFTAAGAGVTDPMLDTGNYRPAGGRAIKYISRGTIEIYDPVASKFEASVTTSAVNMSKALLFALGSSVGGSGAEGNVPYLEHTNSTTITARRHVGGPGDRSTISYLLVEYW